MIYYSSKRKLSKSKSLKRKSLKRKSLKRKSLKKSLKRSLKRKSLKRSLKRKSLKKSLKRKPKRNLELVIKFLRAMHGKQHNDGARVEIEDCPCAICYDDISNIRCACGSCFCSECFKEHLRKLDLNEIEQNLVDFSIKCPSPICNRMISLYEVSQHTDGEEFEIILREWFRLKKHTLEAAIVRDLQNQPVDNNEENRIMNDWIENYLTPQCPNCHLAFNEFNGCFAITCARCNVSFCGWCLEFFSQDSHAHVANCRKNFTNARGVFAPFEVFQINFELRICEKINHIIASEVIPRNTIMNVLNMMRNVLQINNIVVVDGFLQLTDERNARRLQLQGQNEEQLEEERHREDVFNLNQERLQMLEQRRQREEQRRERRELRDAVRRDKQQRREQRIQRKQEQEEQRRQREEQRRQREEERRQRKQELEEQRRQRKQRKQPVPIIPRAEEVEPIIPRAEEVEPIIPRAEEVEPNFPIIPAPNLPVPIIRLGRPVRVVRCGICRLEGHNARNKMFHP